MSAPQTAQPSPFQVHVELFGPTHLDGVRIPLPVNAWAHRITHVDQFGWHLFQRREDEPTSYDYIGSQWGGPQ